MEIKMRFYLIYNAIKKKINFKDFMVRIKNR